MKHRLPWLTLISRVGKSLWLQDGHAAAYAERLRHIPGPQACWKNQGQAVFTEKPRGVGDDLIRE